MALLDRDHSERRGEAARRSGTGGVDRWLLTVALALALLTVLAVLDLHRPVPGSERPVEVRIPPLEAPAIFPAAPLAAKRQRLGGDDDLLVHD